MKERKATKVELAKTPRKVTREEVFKATERARLIPKSSHGKNRVHHQGDTWIIMNESTQVNTVKHRNCDGPFILLEKDGIFRWVSTTDDPDFIVERIT